MLFIVTSERKLPGALPQESQQVLLAVLEDLLQPSGVEEESDMVAGPVLQQQEAPPLKPMHSVPKPDLGIEFRVALAETGQAEGGVADLRLETLTAAGRLQLGLVWAAKPDTVGEMSET